LASLWLDAVSAALPALYRLPLAAHPRGPLPPRPQPAPRPQGQRGPPPRPRRAVSQRRATSPVRPLPHPSRTAPPLARARPHAHGKLDRLLCEQPVPGAGVVLLPGRQAARGWLCRRPAGLSVGDLFLLRPRAARPLARDVQRAVFDRTRSSSSAGACLSRLLRGGLPVDGVQAALPPQPAARHRRPVAGLPAVHPLPGAAFVRRRTR